MTNLRNGLFILNVWISKYGKKSVELVWQQYGLLLYGESKPVEKGALSHKNTSFHLCRFYIEIAEWLSIYSLSCEIYNFYCQWQLCTIHRIQILLSGAAFFSSTWLDRLLGFFQEPKWAFSRNQNGRTAVEEVSGEARVLGGIATLRGEILSKFEAKFEKVNNVCLRKYGQNYTNNFLKLFQTITRSLLFLLQVGVEDGPAPVDSSKNLFYLWSLKIDNRSLARILFSENKQQIMPNNNNFQDYNINLNERENENVPE